MTTKRAKAAPTGVHALSRLVASQVAALPVGDHTDPATPGLQLRVREKSSGMSRTWCLRYKWRGSPVRIVLGHFPRMTLVEARERAQEMRRAMDDGIDPRRARPRRRSTPTPLPTSAAIAGVDGRHTIDFLASEFLERYVRPGRKRPEYVERILNRDVLPPWRGRDARTIQPHEVIELLDGIVERGSRVMANRTAAVVGQLFRFGIHRQIVKDSPVKLLYRPGGKEKPRTRTLTDDELRAFLKNPTACTRFPRLAHAATFLLLTGQRRGELALSRWTDIDFEARTWNIRDEIAKGDRGHVVPLTDAAIAELRALQRLAKRSRWILPANGGEHPIDARQLTRSVAKCRKRFEKAGIAPFTLHDLRRTARTGLSKLKVLPHIAERVLNHAQEKIEGTYDRHAYIAEKREALERWAAHVEALRS